MLAYYFYSGSPHGIQSSSFSISPITYQKTQFILKFNINFPQHSVTGFKFRDIDENFYFNKNSIICLCGKLPSECELWQEGTDPDFLINFYLFPNIDTHIWEMDGSINI